MSIETAILFISAILVAYGLVLLFLLFTQRVERDRAAARAAGRRSVESVSG